MTTPRIEEYNYPSIEHDGEHWIRLVDHMVLTEKQRKEAHQAGMEEIVEKVMSFLKAYKNSLDGDWSLHPLQATSLVNYPPEAVLRQQADAIEAKRRMARDLDDTIKALQDKK
jgi:hypothetical protein